MQVCKLALALACGAVLTTAASAQSPTVELKTEFLMSLEGNLEPGQQVGARTIVNVPSGSFQGPKIKGEIIPPTGDWLVPQPDGSLRLDVRVSGKTDDGELIFIEYNGIIVISKENFERFTKGDVLGPKDMYFITAPRFTTQSKKYSWLNSVQAIGKMTSLQNTKVKYDIFAAY